ncbi:unnamed protein product, partial [Ixodes persulcatus]
EGRRSLDELDDVLRHAPPRQYGYQVVVLDAIIRILDINPGRKQLVVVLLVEHFVEEGLLFGTLAASSSTHLVGSSTALTSGETKVECSHLFNERAEYAVLPWCLPYVQELDLL